MLKSCEHKGDYIVVYDDEVNQEKSIPPRRCPVCSLIESIEQTIEELKS